MRKKNFKGRCEKRAIAKCNEVCRTYDAIQYAYADILQASDEVKEIPKEPAHPELNQQELDMAKMLINSMDKPFEPSLYHDEYQTRLREIIEAKIQGKEIVQAPTEQPDNIINLMDALQASLQQVKDDNKPPKKPGRRKKAETA